MDSEAQDPDLTETAAAWLVSLDAGTADRAAFERWRDADVRHAVAFAEVAATWRDLDAVRPLRTFHPAGTPVPTIPTRRYARRAVIRAAAGTMAAAAIGGGWTYRAYARDRAETAVGERRTIRIDDRLTVDLNTDTILLWRARGDGATLWLDRGEVAIDCAAPVELRTAAGAFALARGAFNARLRERACDLTVLAGQASSEGQVARAGQSALLSGDGLDLRPSGDEIADRVRGWRQGTIILDGDRLDTALAEYNRYLTHKIAIGDARLAGLHLGGRFSTTDPAEFLNALRASFYIQARPTPGGAIILTAT